MSPSPSRTQNTRHRLLQAAGAMAVAAALAAPLGCALSRTDPDPPAQRAALPQPEPTPFKAITSAERRAQWSKPAGPEFESPAEIDVPTETASPLDVVSIAGEIDVEREANTPRGGGAGRGVASAAARRPAPVPPVVISPTKPASRETARRLYREVYLPAMGTPLRWDGDIDQCDAGREDRSSIEATRSVVNYYRTMAGLPGNIVFDPVLSSKCRQAALSFMATPGLSHAIPRGWPCYSPEANEAAQSSNIALGFAGPAAVAAYMEEPWERGWNLTHRQWILYTPSRRMGSGSVEGRPGGYKGANALWVRPARLGPKSTALKWVAWPPKGYVPYPVVYRHWSLAPHIAGRVDMRGATVTMRRSRGDSVALRRGFSNSSYAPDAAVAWIPEITGFGPGMQDESFEIEVSGILVSGRPVSYRYEVTVFDPAA